MSLRSDLLKDADAIISSDRNCSYGPPHADFERTAGMLTALGFQAGGQPLSAHHVAMMIACVKLSRLTWSPLNRDSWLDLAGYAACGHEAAQLTLQLPEPQEQQ